jgi:hypothetical protein
MPKQPKPNGMRGKKPPQRLPGETWPRSVASISFRGRRIADSSRSVLTLKYEDDFCRLGFVGNKAVRLRLVAPAGKIYHCPSRHAPVGVLVRLYDIQSVFVQEERVVAERFVQFRNCWMILGDHLGFELGQSLFDLRAIQLHGGFHSLALWSVRRGGGVARHSYDPLSVAVPLSRTTLSRQPDKALDVPFWEPITIS